MLHTYNDIKNRISEKPEWYDEQGVPRYCDFHPSKVNDIYAKEVILLRIMCQHCAKEFNVALSQDNLAIHKVGSFRDEIEFVHYGDPPRHDACPGESMNCIDLEILEYWEFGEFAWKRIKEFEISLD